MRISLLVLSVFISTSMLYAQNWTRAEELPAATTISTVNHNLYLYTITNDSVYESTNGGTNWAPTASQPASVSNLNEIFSYGNILYVGTRTNGIVRSTNYGHTWEAFNTGLGGLSNYIMEFTAISDTVFVATDGGGIYYLRLSNPSTWHVYNDSLFQYGATAIIAVDDMLIASLGMYVFSREQGDPYWRVISIDSTTEQRPAFKFHRFGNYIFAGTERGVFRGTIDGKNWRKVGISLLPNLSVETFASYKNTIYAGVRLNDEHFICTSTDSGTTWNVWTHDYSVLYDLVVFEDRIFACREDGLWYFDLGNPSDVPPEKGGNLPDVFSLEQNYPNPFNPSTVIRFSLPVSSYVTLKVFDVLGREVAILVDGMQDAGLKMQSFDASSLPSGVYMYKLQAGSYTEVKNMALLK